MDLKDYIRFDNQKWYMQVKVIPNAREECIAWVLDDGTLKIKIRALPERGRANQALIHFIAKQLNVSRDSVEILSGWGARLKIVRICFG
jgi:uncharacterized protein (TIGR00251 family)